MLLDLPGRYDAEDRATKLHRLPDATLLKIIKTLAAGNTVIDDRLRALEKEWAMERVVVTHAGIASLIGLWLGATTSKKWLFLPVVISGALLHAGWPKNIPGRNILRHLRWRGADEIAEERSRLLIGRGNANLARWD